jgi:hypothetical protein
MVNAITLDGMEIIRLCGFAEEELINAVTIPRGWKKAGMVIQKT